MAKGWEILIFGWIGLLVSYGACLFVGNEWNRWRRIVIFPIPIPIAYICALAIGCGVVASLGSVILAPVGMALECYAFAWILFILYMIFGIAIVYLVHRFAHVFRTKIMKFLLRIGGYFMVASGLASLVIYILIAANVCDKVLAFTVFTAGIKQ